MGMNRYRWSVFAELILLLLLILILGQSHINDIVSCKQSRRAIWWVYEQVCSTVLFSYHKSQSVFSIQIYTLICGRQSAEQKHFHELIVCSFYVFAIVQKWLSLFTHHLQTKNLGHVCQVHMLASNSHSSRVVILRYIFVKGLVLLLETFLTDCQLICCNWAWTWLLS